MDMIFISSNEEQSEEQLNQDKAECEMWTFDQIGFPQVYVPVDDPGHGKVTVEVTNSAIGVGTDKGLGAGNGTFTSAMHRGMEQGRRDKERRIVQKALKHYDENPEEAIRTIRPIDPELAMRLEDRLKANQRQAAIRDQYDENYYRAMTACMTARGYTVN